MIAGLFSEWKQKRVASPVFCFILSDDPPQQVKMIQSCKVIISPTELITIWSSSSTIFFQQLEKEASSPLSQMAFWLKQLMNDVLFLFLSIKINKGRRVLENWPLAGACRQSGKNEGRRECSLRVRTMLSKVGGLRCKDL